MNQKEYQQLVLDHLPTVKIIALKIAARLPAGIEFADLIQSGVVGLLNAAARFDPGRGTKFATYASPRIRGAILDELRNLDWASRNLRQKIKDVETVFQVLEKELSRPPSEEEAAARLGMEKDDFLRLLDDARGVGTGVYRMPAADGDSLDEGRLVRIDCSGPESAPPQVLENEEMKKILSGFISALPERERTVLALYYQDDLNLKEIARVLDLTESRISQIRTAAIIRLRGKIAEIARNQQVTEREVL